MLKEINKKIHFYRLFMKKEGKIVDPSTVFSGINQIPFANDERYYNLENGNKWAMYIDSIANPINAKMGTRRENELPTVECAGNMTLLNIPPKSGLYEPTHFTLFPNQVIGVEYNHYGPRISSLKWYIPRKIPDIIDEVVILPLMRTDVLDSINDIGEIKSFEFAAQRNMGQLIEELDVNLSSAFNALKDTSDSEMIEVVMKSARYSKNKMDLPLMSKLGKWLGKTEVSENVDKLKLRARDINLNEYKDFDLLQEYIMGEKQVITIDETHRTVNSNAMYAAIYQAYRDCKPEIIKTIQGE